MTDSKSHLWIGHRKADGYRAVFDTERAAVEHGWKDADAATHYVKADILEDVLPSLRALQSELRVGPDGEGQDWIDTLDAVIEDITATLD